MNEKDTRLSLALLDEIIICGRCGALFLRIGWSNATHNTWHANLENRSQS